MVLVLKRLGVLAGALVLISHPSGAGLRWGLGSAAAKRSADIVDKTAHSPGEIASGGPGGNSDNPVSARVKWSYRTHTMAYSAPAIASDGTIYIGTSDHFVPYNTYWSQGLKPPAKDYGVYAFNSNGTVKWKYTDGTDGPVRGSPALASDGTIYIVIERLTTSQATTSQELHAINPDGTQKWKVTYDTAYTQIGALTPAIASDGTIYVMGADLYAYNPDGTLKWVASHGPSNTFYGTPAIGPDGTIYFVYWNLTQVVQALNPDGTVKWTATEDLGSIPITCSPSLAADGTVYIGSTNNTVPGGNNGALWAFDSTGAFKWKYNTGDYDVRSSPAIAADGTVYFGTKGNNGFIYALNPNGTLKWRHASVDDAGGGIGVDVYSSPAIGANGTIYIASEAGIFYAFNPDGTVKWQDDALNPLGGITWSSPAITADGTLYIGSAYGEFIAVTTDSLGLSATAQWPKFRYDLGNTSLKP